MIACELFKMNFNPPPNFLCFLVRCHQNSLLLLSVSLSLSPELFSYLNNDELCDGLTYSLLISCI